MPVNKKTTQIKDTVVNLPLHEQRLHRVFDAQSAIDEPWFLARYMILQAIKAFKASHNNRQPRLIYIPIGIEACLQVDFARNLDLHVHVRDEKRLFDIPVVWDAAAFKLE